MSIEPVIYEGWKIPVFCVEMIADYDPQWPERSYPNPEPHIPMHSYLYRPLKAGKRYFLSGDRAANVVGGLHGVYADANPEERAEAIAKRAAREVFAAKMRDARGRRYPDQNYYPLWR